MPEMTPRERLMTALRGGVPDRVPCFPSILRWIRYHHGCTCPRHQLKVAEEFGSDALINYGQYTWHSVSNDYVYAPGGGYNFSATGLYGDLSQVDVELRIRKVPQAIADAGKGGGYVLGTGEAVAPETPAESLRAAVEAARAHGVYGRDL